MPVVCHLLLAWPSQTHDFFFRKGVHINVTETLRERPFVSLNGTASICCSGPMANVLLVLQLLGRKASFGTLVWFLWYPGLHTNGHMEVTLWDRVPPRADDDVSTQADCEKYNHHNLMSKGF